MIDLHAAREPAPHSYANAVAMLLRSGTLPGRLSVVDQQIVEPAGERISPFTSSYNASHF